MTSSTCSIYKVCSTCIRINNYSDMLVHTCHNSTTNQGSLCPFMCRSYKRSWLIITGMSPCGIGTRTFALIFAKEVVSLKQWLLINMRNFQINDPNVPKAQGGSKYSLKLILTCLILFSCIVARRHGIVHCLSREYCLYYEL